MVYKDHKIVELNSRVTEQDQVIIDVRELVSEKDEVIRGRNMAIQLLQSTIAQQSSKLQDQESLIARLSDKVERAEIELIAFHERLESDADAGGEDRKLFADQLKTIQENFAELLTKKENELIELRQQIAKHEDTLLAEVAASMNAGIDAGVLSALGRLHHNPVGTTSSEHLQVNTRPQEPAAEDEQLRESLRNKDHVLPLSDEQLLSVNSELQQLCNAVGSSSDISVYTTGSEMSAELPATPVPCEEESSLMNKDEDIPVPENEKQVDRRVYVVRRKPTSVLEITAAELRRNSALKENEAFVKSRESGEESQPVETQELFRLKEELLSLRSSMEAKEAEVLRLEKEILDIRNELAKKEVECTELSESVASFNESDTVLRQELVKSEFLCEELRKELTETGDGTRAKDAELERLREEISANRDQLTGNEERCRELCDLVEESRSVMIEKENLLEGHEQEIARLNDLVSTLQLSGSERETSLTELWQTAVEESQNNSQPVDSALAELAEVKKLNDEMNSLLAEKTTRLDELSVECGLLREAAEKFKTGEQDLTTEIEVVTERRAKDLEKFSADVELIRAEALEKHQQLDGMVQALSEKDAHIFESLREIESLTEVIFQLRTSLGNKSEEIELLRSEAVQKDQQFAAMAQALSEKEANIADNMREIQSLSEAVTRMHDKDHEIELLRSGAIEKDSQYTGMIQALSEKDASIAHSLREIESLMETVSHFRTSVQRKDKEIERLRNQVSAGHEELSGKEEECLETTAAVASSNEPDDVLRPQPTESHSSYEEIETQLAQCGDQVPVDELELGTSLDEVSSNHHELARKDVGTEEPSLMVEENRHLVMEQESVLESLVVELKGEHEETKSLLPEKTGRFEELTQDYESLQETAEKLKNTERQLTARKENDLQKFTADLDLMKTQIAEKDQQLEGMIRALSEQDTKIAGRLGEIESLRETVSQLQISMVNRSDDIAKQKCTVEEQDVKMKEKDLDLKGYSQKLEEHEVMNSEFVSQLSVQEDAIRSMRDELTQSECSSAELRSELTEAKCHMAGIEAELEKLRAAVVQGRDELTSKEDACKELSHLLYESRTLGLEKDSLLAEKSARLEVSAQECELFRDSVDKLQRTEQQLIAELECKDSELVRINADLDLVVAESSEKEQRLEEMIQALSEKDASIAQTVREAQCLSETVSSLQMLLLNKDQEIEQLKSGASETGQQLEGLMQSLTEKDADIAASQREIESLTESVSELQTSLWSKDEVIEQQKLVVQERIKEQDSEMRSCYRKLEEYEVMKTELVSQLSEQEDVMKSLKEELAHRTDDTEKDLQLLKMEMSEKDGKISELSETIASLNESVCGLREQLSKSESSCEELKRELAQMKSNCEMKNAEMDTLLAAISESRDELAKKDEEMTRFATSLNESSVDMKQQLAESELACEQLRNELTESRAEIETKEVELEKLRDEVLAGSDALAKSDERCKELSEILEESKGLVVEKENRIGNCTQEIEELRRQNEETSSLLVEKTAQFDELSHECYLLRDTIDKYKKIELVLTSQVEMITEGKANDLEKFNAELQLLRDESMAKNQQLEDALKCVEVLKMEDTGKDDNILQLTESVAILNRSADVLNEQFARSESSHEELRTKLAKFVDEMDEKDAESDKLVTELDSLRGSVFATRVELAAKDEECKELSKMLKNSSDQLVELELLRTELIAARDQIEAKEVEIGKLHDEVSAKQTELTRKAEECGELIERAESANESLNILRLQLTESETSCDELRTELGKYKDRMEAQDLERDRLHREMSPDRAQSASLSEESRDPRAEKESLLEASSLEASESMSRVEFSEEHVHSDKQMAASDVYDVVECARPRYKIVSQNTLDYNEVAEMMHHWSRFSSLLLEVSVDLQRTTSLTRQCLAAGSEQSLPDSCSAVPPRECDHPDDSTVSLIPLSTLATMAESVNAIRRHVETHDLSLIHI